MTKLTQRQIQPIGLDLGHDSVKMLQIEVKDRALFVYRSARRTVDSSGSAASIRDGELVRPQTIQVIREMLSDNDFHGRNVVTALPRQIVQIKNLRLPMMPAAELAAVVQFEARNIFTFDQNEGHVEFIPAGEVRHGSEVRQEVIVLGAKRTDIDRFLEQLHPSGAVVDSLDAEPCALYRGVERFGRRRDDEQEIHVLVDLGMHRTQVLIGKGRELSFFKSIDIGGGRFNESVSRKLGITIEEARTLRRRVAAGQVEAARDSVRQAVCDSTRSTMEELAKEISLCLRYYSVTFRGQRPGRVRLMGGEAQDTQLLSILNAVANVPVEAARPLFSLNCDAIKDFDRTGPSSEWSLSLGLGLKRTDGKFAPLDGTPRAAALQRSAEVVDLNSAIVAGAGASPAGIAPIANPQAEHFAAVRRAAGTEVSHA
ncbi:MAG: pilus assembly protein PilM [Tepidisphaeraceae bacterium]